MGRHFSDTAAYTGRQAPRARYDRRQAVTALPEVPTVIEAGVRAYEVSLWIGVLVPAATPPSIVDRLDLHMAGILEASDMQQALIAQGWEPDKTTPAAFAQRIRDENGEMADRRKLRRCA